MSSRGLGLLVLAHPRSGSSLVRRILNSHSQICIPFEATFAVWVADQFEQESGSRALRGIDQLERLAESVARSRKFEYWDISRDSMIETWMNGSPRTVDEAMRMLYFVFRDRWKPLATTVGDKNNWYLEVAEVSVQVLQPQLVLLVFRDPVETWRSLQALRGLRLRELHGHRYFPEIAESADSFAMGWSRKYSSALALLSGSKQPWLCIDHAEVVRNPWSVIEAVGREIGLDPEQTPFAEMLGGWELTRPVNWIPEPKNFDAWKAGLGGPISGAASASVSEVLRHSDLSVIREYCSATHEVLQASTR